MPDNTQAIFAQLNVAAALLDVLLGEPRDIRGHVSTFDVAAAREDMATLRAALQDPPALMAALAEVDRLLDTHAQDTGSGVLAVQADYPKPFMLERGKEMSYQFVILGGVSPYKVMWSGDTPAGLTMSEGGLLSGIPLAYGNKTADAIVTDAAGGIYGWSFEMRFAP